MTARKPSRLVACAAATLVAAFVLAGAAAAAPPASPPAPPSGLAAAIAVKNRHVDQLLELAGVVGVGVGVEPNGRHVIRVYLARASVGGVPAELEGFPISRVVTGMIVARGDTVSRYRPAPIGVSTGHPAITAGTIGARVVDPSGSLYALSNNHVYANQNNALIGDTVLQPGTYDGGTNPADAIGTLYDFEPLMFDGSNNTMDAAIALSSAANLGNSTLADGYGTPSETPVAAFVGLPVKKYGRTTSMTQGQVSEVNVTVTVCYEVVSIFCVKSARFVNQISITPGGFSAGGDSGSLVVTQDGNNPVGLLFAGSSTRTLATPIGTVLTRFGVTIDGSPPGNQGPVVDAGPNQTVTLPASAALDATVSDDGLPSPPGAVTTLWAQESGPGTVTFGDASAVDTSASFSVEGTYVLRLTADDGELQTFDTTTITVNPEPGPQPPVVDAGPGQTVTLPASAALDGTVTDDGLPNPPGAVTTQWTQEGGPGTVTFGDASAVDTSASFSAAGTYVLRLTADDGAFQVSDTTTITVNPEPGPGGGTSLYLSLAAPADVGGVSAADEDVLFFDAGGFGLVFDGSDVGIAALRIDALAWLDADTLLLSFDVAGSVPGIAEIVDDSDIVSFDATSLGPTTSGSFQLYFDGSDVGLVQAAEDVDAVEIDANGAIVISTQGPVSVPGVSASDEDLLAFVPLSLGSDTSGAFSLYFQGSDVGLGEGSEDVDAVAFDASGSFHLSSEDLFDVPGVSGQDEDVFVFTPTLLGPTTSGSYSPTLSFDGSAFGLDANDVLGVTIDDASAGNQAPVVDAGPDQTVTLPASAALDGTVSDDGLPSPPGAVTTQWALQSGPGTVTFGDASAVDTTASFSAAGTYVLRLTADDGAAQSADTTTVTVNPEPGPGGGTPLYLSLGAPATLGGVSAADEDVLFFDGSGFSLVFDGSDVGVEALRIDALAWLDADTLLLSFDVAGSVPGIAEIVDDSDIVSFDATSLGPATSGSFQLYFDGSDVGLTQAAEDVDAIEVDADGTIVLSTQGPVTVPGLSAWDEDLLAFLPLSLGSGTSGVFMMYFQGSDVGLGEGSEDVDAVAIDASGVFHLSAEDLFDVPGVSGQDEDVFVFTPTLLGPTTSGSYSPTLSFDGSSFGLDANDVLAVELP
jgi:hypothetical protein